MTLGPWITSFRGALLREPGIHNPGTLRIIPTCGYGFRAPRARARRPGMMEWTAPDGIISAKLVVLIRSSKGDRPWRRLA